jgi:hypothetical protein
MLEQWEAIVVIRHFGISPVILGFQQLASRPDKTLDVGSVLQ